MACNYQPLAKSADGLTWKLRGQGVKTMTEDDVIEDGKIKGARKANKYAQEWADRMTEKYSELAVKDKINEEKVKEKVKEIKARQDNAVMSAVEEYEEMKKELNTKK